MRVAWAKVRKYVKYSVHPFRRDNKLQAPTSSQLSGSF